MPTPPSRFFAPTYFTPFYFPPLIAAGSQPAALGASPYRDGEAFAAIASALRATGEFADVSFGTTLERWPGGADRSPAAVITPDSWTEVDDVDPIELVRRVFYTLTIVVRDEDPLARYATLDRLTGVAQNAIDGSDLRGECLPALTLLRRGRFDPGSKHPEQGVILDGEFTYLIPSMTGHLSRY